MMWTWLQEQHLLPKCTILQCTTEYVYESTDLVAPCAPCMVLEWCTTNGRNRLNPCLAEDHAAVTQKCKHYSILLMSVLWCSSAWKQCFEFATAGTTCKVLSLASNDSDAHPHTHTHTQDTTGSVEYVQQAPAAT